jgi:hypothetical protein
MITEFWNAYKVMKAQITTGIDDDDLAIAIEIYTNKISTLQELMMELSGKELETILDMRDCFVRLKSKLELQYAEHFKTIEQ